MGYMGENIYLGGMYSLVILIAYEPNLGISTVYSGDGKPRWKLANKILENSTLKTMPEGGLRWWFLKLRG